MTITDTANLADYCEINLDDLLSIKLIKEYIGILYRFFKNKTISLNRK